MRLTKYVIIDLLGGSKHVGYPSMPEPRSGSMSQHGGTLEQLNVLRTALAHAKAQKASDTFVKAHIAALRTDIARLEQEVADNEKHHSNSKSR